MSRGLVKAKKYDWKDSNLALFGSDTEKEIKKESAEGEPAWTGAGQEVGVKVWRIVNFEVTNWEEEDYGEFFAGDSYIVLNTYKPDPDSEELAFDVHFWIGKHSSQDEYGTAAYKTVELDTFLDDRAVQHREVQGHESAKFISYFDKLIIVEGGASSGFRIVEPETYTPRLLHFSGKGMKIAVREVPFSQKRLVSADVFILDMGNKFYQWNGKDASGGEKFKAAEFLAKIRGERGIGDYEVIEEEDTPTYFYDLLPDEDVDDEDEPDGSCLKLVRVSDSAGRIDMQPVKDDEITRDDLDSNDVFLVDNGKKVFVWVGKNASSAEKRNGLPYAHNYLASSGFPYLPITVVREGQKNEEFTDCFSS